MAIIIKAAINKKMLSRFIPCIYFIHCDFGRFGSGLLKYKYSLICFKIPIKKLYHKDTVKQRKSSFCHRIKAQAYDGY